MGLAAVANWLFNFALGLFVPPAFGNISWKTFIVFGVLCFAAAVQAFLTYPETCGKTLEEVELLFSKEGPWPWKTRPGGSRLDEKVGAVRDRGASVGRGEGGGGSLEKEAVEEVENVKREVEEGKGRGDEV